MQQHLPTWSHKRQYSYVILHHKPIQNKMKHTLWTLPLKQPLRTPQCCAPERTHQCSIPLHTIKAANLQIHPCRNWRDQQCSPLCTSAFFIETSSVDDVCKQTMINVECTPMLHTWRTQQCSILQSTSTYYISMTPLHTTIYGITIVLLLQCIIHPTRIHQYYVSDDPSMQVTL